MPELPYELIVLISEYDPMGFFRVSKDLYRRNYNNILNNDKFILDEIRCMDICMYGRGNLIINFINNLPVLGSYNLYSYYKLAKVIISRKLIEEFKLIYKKCSLDTSPFDINLYINAIKSENFVIAEYIKNTSVRYIPYMSPMINEKYLLDYAFLKRKDNIIYYLFKRGINFNINDILIKCIKFNNPEIGRWILSGKKIDDKISKRVLEKAVYCESSLIPELLNIGCNFSTRIKLIKCRDTTLAKIISHKSIKIYTIRRILMDLIKFEKWNSLFAGLNRCQRMKIGDIMYILSHIGDDEKIYRKVKKVLINKI